MRRARSRVVPAEEQELVDALVGWASEELGPVAVVADRSQQRARALVLEITAEDGGRWFLKRPVGPVNFTRELAAYETFLGHLADAAPRLRAASTQHQSLLLSPVPGRSADLEDLRADHGVHRRAGRWAARLHAAAPPLPGQAHGRAMARRLRLLAARNVHTLGDATSGYLAQVASHLSALSDDVTLVPCHLDYTPRNWVVRDDGEVSVVDFCTCRRSFAMHDFGRLAVRYWSQRPDLRAEFLDGYGRGLGRDDQALLESCTAVVAVALLNKGATYGNPEVTAQCLRTLDQLQGHSLLSGRYGRA